MIASKNQAKREQIKGFTLIEIVSVLVILGILVAVAAAKYFDLKDEAEKKAAESVLAEAQARINSRFGQLLLEGKSCPVAVSEVNKPEAVGDLGGDYTVSWNGELLSGTPTPVDVKKGERIVLSTGTLLAPQCDDGSAQGGGSGGQGGGSGGQGGGSGGQGGDSGNQGGDSGNQGGSDSGNNDGQTEDNWKNKLPYKPIPYDEVNHWDDKRGVLVEKDGKIYVTKWDASGVIDWIHNPEVTGFTTSAYENGQWAPQNPEKGQIYQEGNKFYVCASDGGCSNRPNSSVNVFNGWITIRNPSEQQP